MTQTEYEQELAALAKVDATKLRELLSTLEELAIPIKNAGETLYARGVPDIAEGVQQHIKATTMQVVRMTSQMDFLILATRTMADSLDPPETQA